jgi:hypothetical protein
MNARICKKSKGGQKYLQISPTLCRTIVLSLVLVLAGIITLTGNNNTNVWNLLSAIVMYAALTKNR